MMTKKHFQDAARRIAVEVAYNAGNAEYLLEIFSKFFQNDNPRFNCTTFVSYTQDLIKQFNDVKEMDKMP